MIDIVDRLSFDATRCEVSFSKGVASNIEDGIAEIKRLRAENTTLRNFLGGILNTAQLALADYSHQQSTTEPK